MAFRGPKGNYINISDFSASDFCVSRHVFSSTWPSSIWILFGIFCGLAFLFLRKASETFQPLTLQKKKHQPKKRGKHVQKFWEMLGKNYLSEKRGKNVIQHNIDFFLSCICSSPFESQNVYINSSIIKQTKTTVSSSKIQVSLNCFLKGWYWEASNLESSSLAAPSSENKGFLSTAIGQEIPRRSNWTCWDQNIWVFGACWPLTVANSKKKLLLTNKQNH